MKGGLVVMLYALKALNHFGELADKAISILLNSDDYSEGVSIYDVTMILNVTLYPRWIDYVQAFGRGLRSCGHVNLDVAQRRVQLVQLVATLGQIALTLPPEVEAYIHQRLYRGSPARTATFHMWNHVVALLNVL